MSASVAMVVLAIWLVSKPWGPGRATMLVLLLGSLFAAIVLVAGSTRKPRKAMIVRASPPPPRSQVRNGLRWAMALIVGLIVSIAWSIPVLLRPTLGAGDRVAAGLLLFPIAWAVAAAWLLGSERIGKVATILVTSGVIAAASSVGMALV
ncbi:MAG: hypothetical protein HC788_03005 [Sphingopyxis sp.]|nr:hypothetical protein [Sphingopyxis sp.]